MESLVSTDWLGAHLADPELVIIDASWFMPTSGRNGRTEFLHSHIPGARFFDMDELSDHENLLPHMMPAAADFARGMEELGISAGDRIIVYDNSPLRTSARAWFMLRHFGATNVAILNGGLQKWTAEGRATEAGYPSPRRARFIPNERDEIVTKEQLIAGTSFPWVDARAKGRFEGADPDPRPGVARGHGPGARNLPFSSFYDDQGCVKQLSEIRRLFTDAGIDPAQPFVASCGSGVTANTLVFAAHLLGNDEGLLYDGSWSEWGADPATPKLIGPA